MSQRDEFGLIHWITGQRSSTVTGVQQEVDVVRVGIGDDAAVVRFGPNDEQQHMELLLTVDTMVDGIHFTDRTMSKEDVGYKAMSAAISDIAAMGGIAKTALVSASIPKTMDQQLMYDLFTGLDQSACDHGVKIVGGDTVSTTGPLTLTVTITGEVEKNKAILRSGAQTGDVVFITGELGLSAAGLDWMLNREELPMKDSIRKELTILKTFHQRPKAQLQTGRLLLESGVVTSLNDISDGLVSECYEIAEASGKNITLFEELIPIAPELVRYGVLTDQPGLSWVLYGGEDYQLVGTAPGIELPRIQTMLYEYGIHIVMIGMVNESKPNQASEVELMWNNEQRALLEKKGYNHFGGEK